MKHGKVRMIFVVLSLSFLFKVDCGFIINIHGKLEIIFNTNGYSQVKNYTLQPRRLCNG
jgi:hypothetical protein